MGVEVEASGQGMPQRTLFIGLGGTGRDILLRVRRFIFEKWRVPSLPFTEFVWVDTDTEGTMPSGMRDTITERIDFSVTEQLNISMTANEIRQYFGAGQMDPFGQSALRPSGFLDPSLGAYCQALQHGAGQIRCFGRLALWHKAVDFERKINHALHNLARIDTIEQAMQQGHLGYAGLSRSEIKIVVVAGLAGGTGSGTFIDAAVFLRELVARAGVRAKLTSVLVLPSVFIDMRLGDSADPDVLAANGYAALKELDYYQMPRGDRGRQNESYAFPGVNREIPVTVPLYDMIFLVDSQLASGEKFDKPTEAFRVAADVLAVELDRTEFARTMRTELSNMVKEVVEPTSLPVKDRDGELLYNIPVHRRYAALGHAQIELDRDRLRNAAAYRLGEMLVQFMRRRGGDATHLEPMIQKDIENPQRIGLTSDAIVGQMLRDAEGRDIAKLWEDRITREVGAIEQEVKGSLGRVSGDEPLKALTHLKNLLGSVHQRYRQLDVDLREEAGQLLQLTGTKQDHGPHHRAIERQAPKALATVQERINAVFVDVLADPVEQGIPAAESLLQLCSSQVARLARDPLARAAEAEPAIPSIGKGERVAAARLRVQEAELIPRLVFPFSGIAMSIAQAELVAAVEADLHDIRGSVSAYLSGWRRRLLGGLLSPYDDLVRSHYTKLLKKLEQWLGEEKRLSGKQGEVTVTRSGMRRRLEQYEQRLERLEAGQRQMADAFKDAERGARNVVVDQSLDEQDLLFRHCLLDDETGVSAEDPAHRRDALTDTMRDFFSEANLISGETKALLVDAADSVTLDAIKEGMRELATRAEAAEDEPAPWREVGSRLEAFCFEKTEALAALRSLDAAIELQRHTPEDQHDAARRVASNSVPCLKLRTWPELRPRRRSFVAASQQHADSLRPKLIEAGLPADSRVVPNERGNVIVYQDFFALPIVLLDAVPSLRNYYLREIAKHATRPLLRHSDCRWRRFPDINFTWELDYWRTSRDRLRLLLPGILLNVVGWSGSGEDFTMKVWSNGLLRERVLGSTLGQAVSELSEDNNAGLVDTLRAMVTDKEQELLAPGRTDALAAYAGACQHLVHRVFLPQTLDGEDSRTPIQVVAKEMYQKVVNENLSSALGLSPHTSDGKPHERLLSAMSDAKQFLGEITYADPECRDTIHVVDWNKLSGSV